MQINKHQKISLPPALKFIRAIKTDRELLININYIAALDCVVADRSLAGHEMPASISAFIPTENIGESGWVNLCGYKTDKEAFNEFERLIKWLNYTHDYVFDFNI